MPGSVASAVAVPRTWCLTCAGFGI